MKKINEPIKTKKAIMKTMKFFSMAALALVGTVMTGCSSEDDLAGNQQSAKQDNIVTVTTTVGVGSGTRALSEGGVKTFEVGDQIALFYEQDGSWDQFKAVATAENISADGKSATFTFTLTNPKPNYWVTLSYPADFMDEVPMELYPAFAQDGTLNGGVKANDLGFATGKLVGTDLPASITLTNRFAVVAFTLKDGKGTADKGDDEEITGDITEMTINLPDHEDQTYTITRSAADGPIYVVLPPISEGETINITATGGGKTYTKTLDNKTYAASNFYQQGLLMTEAAIPGVLNGQFSVSSTDKVYFSKGNLQATTTNNGTSWTWAFAEHQWDYIGNAAANNAINGNGTVSANGTVDLFGWSTAENYLGIHNSNEDGAYSGDFVDWGTVSGIGEGWYTLSKDEWVYLFETRSDAANKYGFATVNSVHGIIILPDAFVDPNKNNGSNAFVGSTTKDWDDNVYTAENWTLMEAAGAVFLPAAGYRGGVSVGDVGSYGGYWSSSAPGEDIAFSVFFQSGYFYDASYDSRYYGASVRLVRAVE